MPEVTLRIFDPDITENSPAGSCLLKMLRAAATHYRLEVVTSQADLSANEHVRIYKLPVPMKPVFAQSILFTIASILFDRFAPGEQLKISTQGGFPFCDISYAHCCHKLFLTRYRANISGGIVTRSARLLNHSWSALMEMVAFKRARVIVVPSEGLGRELAEAYGLAVAQKLHVIPNPVDCAKFAPAMPAAEARPFTFAFCALGNFEWKGLALIIDALKAVGPRARLLVIGGTEAEISRSRSVNDQVTFVGLQRDIRPYLWESDAFVFPSVYETFPLVCLQAAACGLPLIATDLYGLEELLQPGVSGWRVERTVKSITTAMQAAIADPGLTFEMGRNAQALAQKYDEPEFLQRWLKLLSALAG